jgi:protoheme IX farnesyltransferase
MAKSGFFTKVIAIAALIRIKLSLAIAFSCFAGYVIVKHVIDPGALAAFGGVALLSFAGSALNQFQERREDALMERTKERPLMRGVFNPRQVIVIAAIFALAGSLLILFGSRPVAAILGIGTLVWYNGIYTPLKRRTVFALPIGAISGAMAPIIGWSAASGGIDRRVVCIALFMFFWQMGHFLLLLLKFGKEYERAGIRTLVSLIDVVRLRTVSGIWLLGTAACVMLFPLFGVLTGLALTAALVLVTMAFAVTVCARLVLKKEPGDFRPVFGSMYLFQAAVIMLMIAEGLFSGRLV